MNYGDEFLLRAENYAEPQVNLLNKNIEQVDSRSVDLNKVDYFTSRKKYFEWIYEYSYNIYLAN